MKGALFALVFLALPSAFFGLSPTRSQHSWVAGTGEPGDADGPFMVASFNRPEGIIFDGAGNSLIVADSGNHCLRAVALGRQNSTSTLALAETGSGAAFRFLTPTCLAWKQDGALLYCLDTGKPGVAVVDLRAGTGTWLPLPLTFTSKTGQVYSLADAHALNALPGQFAVLSFSAPSAVLVFDLPRNNFMVCNLAGAPGGLDDLMCAPDGLWAINRNLQSLFRLAPAKAPGDWLRSFSVGVTSTATCPDWIADTSVGRGLGHPWSFVRGPSGVEVACDAPQLMAYQNGQGGFDTWCMLDRHGKKIGLQNDTIYDEQLHVLKTRIGDLTIGPKRLFRRPAYVCEDASDDRWYLSETDSQRIVSFSRTIPDDPAYPVPQTELGYDGIMDTMFPQAKKPGVHRIAVFSSCYFKESKDTQQKMDTFSKRFQWYLNVFSTMRDSGPYEIVFFGDTLGANQSYTGRIKEFLARAVGKYHCDEVFLAMRPRDLMTVINAYQSFPMDKDGLPTASLDPEYLTGQRTWADLAPSPLYTDLARYIIANQNSVHTVGIYYKAPALFQRDGAPDWSDNVKYDFQNQVLMDKVFRLYVHDMGILKKEMEAQAAADGRTVQVTLALFPEQTTLGPQESATDDDSLGALGLIRRHFRDLCGTLGIRYLDLVDEMRVFSLDSPLNEVWDGHPTANGADLTALVAAQRYLDPAPALPTEGSSSAARVR